MAVLRDIGGMDVVPKTNDFISVPAGTTFNDCHIFGQDDKTNNHTDKNGTKIHIVSQLDPCNLFPLSSGIRVFSLADQNPLNHRVAFKGSAAPSMNLYN